MTIDDNIALAEAVRLRNRKDFEKRNAAMFEPYKARIAELEGTVRARDEVNRQLAKRVAELEAQLAKAASGKGRRK